MFRTDANIAEEWIHAKNLLANKADGAKLKRLSNFQFTVNINGAPFEVKEYTLINSYIKINGMIYKLSNGENAIVGQGGFAKIKRATNSEGKDCVIKIVKFDNSNGRNKLQRDLADNKNEGKILKDLNLSSGYVLRTINKTPYKQYTAMENMGTDLLVYLFHNQKKLSDEARFKLAFKVCWEVHKLHSGESSKSKTPYAHLDIKPQNFCIDNDGNLHLIDFGFSKKHPQEKYISARHGLLCGTPAYMSRNYKKMTFAEWDVFALKRTLYMPSAIINLFGKPYFPKTLAIFDSPPPKDISDLLSSNVTAHQLAAAFVFKQYGFNIKLVLLDIANKALEKLCRFYSKHLESNTPSENKIKEYCQKLVNSINQDRDQFAEDILKKLNIDSNIFSKNDERAQAICNVFLHDRETINNLGSICRIFKLTDELELKRADFKKRKEPAAVASCSKLLDVLNEQIDNLADDKINDSSRYHQVLAGFQSKCTLAVNESKDILECHSGFKGFLDGFLTALCSLVVFYPAALLIKHFTNTPCLFFKTDSAKKLDKLETNLSALKP